MVCGNELLNKHDHLRNVFGGSGFHVWRQIAKICHVIMKSLDRPRCDDGYSFAGLLMGLYDFVIYIRNVSRIGYVILP